MERTCNAQCEVAHGRVRIWEIGSIEQPTEVKVISSRSWSGARLLLRCVLSWLLLVTSASGAEPTHARRAQTFPLLGDVAPLEFGSTFHLQRSQSIGSPLVPEAWADPSGGVANVDDGTAFPAWSTSWSTIKTCVLRAWEMCPAETSSQPAGGPRGRRVLTILALTGTLAAVALAVDAPETPRWSAGNKFDDAFRDAFRATSSSGRNAAAITSDVLQWGMLVGTVADWWWQDKRGRYRFGKMAMADSTWIISNLLVTQTLKVTAARERPYVEPCMTNPDYSKSCSRTSQFNQSFFSGHSSITANLAGLTCSRHLSTAKRDGWDIGVCGGAVLASLTAGLLRMTAEKHYASDVFVGWASGALFGYVLPRMVDYKGADGAFSRVALTPVTTTRHFGARLSLRF
jgi:membrane-associated phospholipid phosphatase